MAVASISSGVAFVLLALAVPPPAAQQEPALADHRFDLAAVSLTQSQLLPLRAPEGAQPPALLVTHEQFARHAWTPPRKTWGSAEQGPVFQIGALGSTDKRVPDLAHVSFDWDF